MKQYIHFVLDPDHDTSNWKLSFSKDGTNIFIGLHWNDKEIPTHSFTCTEADFRKMAGAMLGVVI